jgi:hypothetical protein
MWVGGNLSSMGVLSVGLRRAGAALLGVGLALGFVETVFPQVQIPLIGLLLSALSLLSFLIHEVGHPLFGLLGAFLGALGGTLAQLLFPLGVGALAFSRRQLIWTFFIFWAGQGLTEISRYIGDARAQQLHLFAPLTVFGGPSPTHDWNYLLGVLGLLPFDRVLAALAYAAGLLVMALAVAGCAWAVIKQKKE